MERRLAAVLVADVVGYSQLMGRDEVGTLKRLKAHREELLEVQIGEHQGRIVKLIGDGILAEFPSVVEAVQCAVRIQEGMAERNRDVREEEKIEFRIGVNLGDVIIEDDDIYGDGVNIAARLEGLAEPGGICVSRTVRNQVRDTMSVWFEDQGEHTVKNIERPIRIFQVRMTPVEGGLSRSAKNGRTSSGTRIYLLGAALVLLLLVGSLAAWLKPWQTPNDVEAGSKPTIAVLPFSSQNSGATDEYFNDGITADIISALGRFQNLMVFSRSAVFAYKDKPISPDKISKELGARYLVTGSIHKVSDRVRVSAELSDAQLGTLIWSDRFERNIDDIFAVQDEISQKVVSALIKRLDLEEQARALDKPTGNLEAYDYVLQGRHNIHKGTRATNFSARELFKKAVELDPDYAAAHSWLARTHLHDALYGWTQWPVESLKQSRKILRTAISLDDGSSLAHQLFAEIYLLEGRYSLALTEAEKALVLNPNQPQSQAIQGLVHLWQGSPDEAIPYLESAVRFDPQIDNGYFVDLGLAYFLLGRYDDAIRRMEQLRVRAPDYAYTYIPLTAAYSAAGRRDEAEDAANNLKRLSPFFSSTEFAQRFLRDEHRSRIISVLRGVGLN